MKCLRCGRDAVKGSFCESCQPLVQEPLQGSSYLHTQIVLPTRKEQPIVKKTEPKKERKRRPWGWMLATVLLLLLCTALFLQGAFYAYTKARQGAELENVRASAAEDAQDVEFLREQVVFIQNDTTKRYHRYDCPLLLQESYRIYTPQQARNMGYESCPVCP